MFGVYLRLTFPYYNLFQWVFGLSCYLLPGLPVSLKKFYMPHHVFWGLALFGLAAATSLMGIVERTIFQIK